MIRCAVVGASGYSGAELVCLLAAHPRVELAKLCAAGSAGQRFEELHPDRQHLHQGLIEAFQPEALEGLDVVFLALPHGESAKAAAALRDRVAHVIDLSGDLRLPDAESYRRWYGQEHPAPELLGQAAYGLPELFGCALPGARLVACAGCYATVSQLAAAPFLALGPAFGGRVAISAASGTTGAGRKGDLALSFSEVFGDLRPYRVGKHQHAPEIAQGLTRHAGRSIQVTFVPQLAPIDRGILATIVIENPPVNAGGLTPERAQAALEEAYAERPFVRVLEAGRWPSVKAVRGTNYCDLAVTVDEAGASLVVTGAIDNLVKGAAGQAVQVMNLVLGWPETTGLPGGALASGGES